ncbi:hypothetical protein D3C80_2076840 [compost metagenome]
MIQIRNSTDLNGNNGIFYQIGNSCRLKTRYFPAVEIHQAGNLNSVHILSNRIDQACYLHSG